jgi:hypothetical protein
VMCMARTTRYMFESYEKKPIVFESYCCFHELLPTGLAFWGNLQ